MTIYEMFVQMWIIDYQIKIFDKPYFQGLVQNNQLTVADYKKIVGEDYATQPNQVVTPQA